VILLFLACPGTIAPLDADPGLLLIVETGKGRTLFVDHADGSVLGQQCVSELEVQGCGSEGCLFFGVEHALVDGDDALTFAFTWADDDQRGNPGALAQVVPGHPPNVTWSSTELDFSVADPELAERCPNPQEPLCRLNMVHALKPWDDQWVVADTQNSRLLWVETPAGPDEPMVVTARLDDAVEGWDGFLWSNHVQVLEEGDRRYVLTTWKGGDFPEVAPRNTGRIALWDATDPTAIEHLWSFPEEGYLAAVHHAERYGDLLIYSHSLGASHAFEEGDNGTVGVATWNGTDPPTYLADLIMPVGRPAFGFVREAELVGEGVLLVTDSGCENPDVVCGISGGGIVEMALPELEPTGLTGAFSPDHDQQEIVHGEVLGTYLFRSLDYPYEADLMSWDEVGRQLTEGVGACP